MRIIAIVGFGFCGRLSFYHLTKSASSNFKIIIFDKAKDNKFGSAFSYFSPNYILNVTAKKMSAFSDKVGDFCDFLKKNYPQIYQLIGEDGFATRYIYGKYLEQITDQAFKNAKENNIQFDLVDHEVVNIDRHLKITTSDNKTYEVSDILMANGLTQAKLSFQSSNPNYIENLWGDDLKAGIFHQQQLNAKKICLIGSGLSSVDVLVNLKRNNFAGEIVVISRRGNLPRKHFMNNPIISRPINPDDAKDGLVSLCLKIRKFLAENKNCDLRQVVDSMRDITKKLWQNFDSKNKTRFLRILPYWNIFRHRSPQSSIALIDEMIASGQAKIKKSGFKKIIEKDQKFVVESADEEFVVDYLVNCLGFELNSKKYSLLEKMAKEGLLEEDSLLFKSKNPAIHLVGGLNIGRDFESTSVPDLRIDVEEEVRRLKSCHSA